MKNNLEKIKDLLNYLSERDRQISQNLIESKKFHTMRELIISCIHKLKQNPKDFAIEEKVIMLELLYSELDNYILLIFEDDGRDEWFLEEEDILNFNEIIEEI